MLTVTFIIAIVSLMISVLAYRRAGGAKELKKTVDSLTSTMESLKEHPPWNPSRTGLAVA
jgi:hypothetical protein